MSENLYKPGTDNAPSGQYREVGPRGAEVSDARTVNIEQGDRLPPTQDENRLWEKI